MFGLGIWEIAIIAVVVLVFVRPADLPKVMRRMGSLYGRFTSTSRKVMQQFREPFNFEDEAQGPGIAVDPQAPAAARPADDRVAAQADEESALAAYPGRDHADAGAAGANDRAAGTGVAGPAQPTASETSGADDPPAHKE